MSSSVHDVYQESVVRVHAFRQSLHIETVVLIDILAHDANFGCAAPNAGGVLMAC